MNINEILNAINSANSTARKAYEAAQKLGEALQNERAARAQLRGEMSGLVAGVRYSTNRMGTVIGLPDVLHIEDIPGRRVPFDVSVKLRIAPNSTSKVENSYTVTEHGPFVAVGRYATFLSSYTFSVVEDGTSETYVGRSFGRFRPVSSVIDFMDAQQGWQQTYAWSGLAAEGCGASDATPVTALTERPTNRSPFRTMSFDGYCGIRNTVFPRQNEDVPLALWAPGIESMMQLPVLDYFERGETIEFWAEPTHVNNPAAGNIDALVGAMPFLAGQYDGHEGIKYDSWLCTTGATDTVTRSPAGILQLGYFGYRILHPSGVRVPG